MTTEYIRYTIPPERAEVFENDYRAAFASLDQSPYCQGYALTRCVEEPSSYVLRIEWTSIDDHLRGFRASPEFRAFFRRIQPYIDLIDEMRHYAPVGGPATDA